MKIASEPFFQGSVADFIRKFDSFDPFPSVLQQIVAYEVLDDETVEDKTEPTS